MTTLKQILMKNLNERFIKECLTLTPDDIYEELQKSVKEWLQQHKKIQNKKIADWGQEDMLNKLLEELEQ